MDLICQRSAKEKLRELKNCHSILIEGPQGSGKTYLAKQWADENHILDFVSIKNKAADIRELLEQSYARNEPVIYCVENLDKGSPSASAALLKFLEEPTTYVYIIVTVESRYGVPETILSRAQSVEVVPPSKSDINQYAMNLDQKKYNQYAITNIWKAVRSFKDVKYLFSLTLDQVKFYQDIGKQLSRNKSVYEMSWAISKFPKTNDNTDLRFVLQCIYSQVQNDERVKRHTLEALSSLDNIAISNNQILAKYLFDFKYTA